MKISLKYVHIDEMSLFSSKLKNYHLFESSEFMLTVSLIFSDIAKHSIIKKFDIISFSFKFHKQNLLFGKK
jgi:hypothetical protein